MIEPAPGPDVDPATAQVWDLPLRLWHWLLAAAVLVALVTPNTYDDLHRNSGYAVLVLVVFRIVWGFAGGRYARFSGIFVKLRAFPGYIRRLWQGKAGRYLGLNPAGTAMMIAFIVLLLVSGITGAMQVTVRLFGVWWVEDTHAVTSNAILVLVPLHIAGVIVVRLMQRENLICSMFTGKKRAARGRLMETKRGQRDD